MVPYARFFASFASVRAHVQRGPTAAAGAARSVPLGIKFDDQLVVESVAKNSQVRIDPRPARVGIDERGHAVGKKAEGRPPTTRVCGFEKTLVSIGAALVITDSS